MWSAWSSCSHTCSGKTTEGKQMRARSILAYAGEGRVTYFYRLLFDCEFSSVLAVPKQFFDQQKQIIGWSCVGFVCSFVLFCFVPFLTFPPSLSVLFPFTRFLLTFPNFFHHFSLLPYPFYSLPNLAPRLIFLLKVLYRKNYGTYRK